MKYALIDNKKSEATKGAKGLCPICGSELIARCGEIKINHWAHKGKRNCDPWWENETEWHRYWKNLFPSDWQEIVQFDNKGEKHIADIKTEFDWVLEFQHSYLNPDERRARNTFYPKLVWVVDGLRRKRDIQQFQNLLKEGKVLNKSPLIVRVYYPDECRLLSEWLDSDAYIFFDFNEYKSKDSFLWFIVPMKLTSEIRVVCFPVIEFIRYHRNGKFDEIIEIINEPNQKKPTKNTMNKQIRRGSIPNYIQRKLAWERQRKRRSILD